MTNKGMSKDRENHFMINLARTRKYEPLIPPDQSRLHKYRKGLGFFLEHQHGGPQKKRIKFEQFLSQLETPIPEQPTP